jgi:hypothetical protein
MLLDEVLPIGMDRARHMAEEVLRLIGDIDDANIRVAEMVRHPRRLQEGDVERPVICR